MDVFSVLIGLFCGGCIGFITAGLLFVAKLEEAKDKYEQLYREYSRITDRDSRGRFTKRS